MGFFEVPLKNNSYSLRLRKEWLLNSKESKFWKWIII